VHAIAAHVGTRSDADRLVMQTIEHFGSLDILVNNAATNPYFGPLVDISDSQMQKTYEVNQTSVLTHSAAAWHQWMKEHGGVILNVASIGGLGPEPGIGWYNVTKAAVIHLTKQLANSPVDYGRTTRPTSLAISRLDAWANPMTLRVLPKCW